MSKIFFTSVLFLFATVAFAQESKSVDAGATTSSTKQLQAERDTLKSHIRLKNQENTRDINRLIKLENSNKSLKDQLKSAKKANKTDKVETLQAKINDNTATIKELDIKIKAGEKEVDQMEKDLKNAEKALKTSKENDAKAKAKK